MTAKKTAKMPKPDDAIFESEESRARKELKAAFESTCNRMHQLLEGLGALVRHDQMSNESGIDDVHRQMRSFQRVRRAAACQLEALAMMQTAEVAASYKALVAKKKAV